MSWLPGPFPPIEGSTIMFKEPALILGALSAVINLAVGFGLGWSAEQVSLVNVALAAIVAVAVRQQVTPVSK